MKKKTALIILGIVLLAVLALLLRKKPASQDFVLKRTDVDYSILASCTVSFPEPYVMKARAAGDVVGLPVAEGQKVGKGDLLVQIDDFRERQNLAIAESQYQGLKLKMANSREEVYPRLREQLNDASSKLEEARSHAERIGALFNAGAVSRVEWEKAGTALDAARARFNGVKLQVDAYAQSGAAAELASQLNALDAQVQLARRAVADKRLAAPYDCIVVKLDARPGETVAAGQKAVTVLERRPWVLEANVDQKDLGFLETGLPAAVRFDAYPAETVRAHVSLVCSVIDLDKGTCELKIRVAEERPFIKHGMTGSVEIAGRKIAGVNAGVLALPARYLIRGQGEAHVLLRGKKGLARTPVEFTPIGEKWVSVRNLPEGAQVALPE